MYNKVLQRAADFSFTILHTIIFVLNSQKLTKPFADFQKVTNK